MSHRERIKAFCFEELAPKGPGFSPHGWRSYRALREPWAFSAGSARRDTAPGASSPVQFTHFDRDRPEVMESDGLSIPIHLHAAPPLQYYVVGRVGLESAAGWLLPHEPACMARRLQKSKSRTRHSERHLLLRCPAGCQTKSALICPFKSEG